MVAEIGTRGLGAWSAAVARVVDGRRYIGGTAHCQDHSLRLHVTHSQQQNMCATGNYRAASLARQAGSPARRDACSKHMICLPRANRFSEHAAGESPSNAIAILSRRRLQQQAQGARTQPPEAISTPQPGSQPGSRRRTSSTSPALPRSLHDQPPAGPARVRPATAGKVAHV